MKIRTLTTLLAAGASALTASAVNIDGIITGGEWAGASVAIIGNGGGTAYLKADANFVYGAFDITGWTAAMGADSQGNLLGFGVWKANNGYGNSAGVEFQQATDKASWGGDGPSGTMNGLDSAFRLSTVLQGSIPVSLQAMDSFASGHRVWEVIMPISTMGVSVGDTIWAVGGINYGGNQHWYGAPWSDPYPATYVPVTVEAGATPPVSSVPDSGTTLALLGGALAGLAALRMKFIA